MRTHRLGRTLAIGVVAVAGFSTISDLSMPVADRRPALLATVTVATLLIAHAAAYWFGDRLRERLTLSGYIALQAALVFLAGLMVTFVPVMLALYVALTVETVVTAGPRWGTMAITVAAIVLFGANAAFAWGVYRAATVALLLAVVGVIAHAVAALVRRRPADEAVRDDPVRDRQEPADSLVVRQPTADAELDFDRRELARLTAREREVLRALTRGARTSEIADQLEIAERTVKAHLANIYQKLGVESRTAAVAIALQKEPSRSGSSR